MFGQQMIGEPEGEAIHQNRLLRRQGLHRFCQSQRGIMGLPPLAPGGAMMGDALAHFIIQRLGSGNIGPWAGQRLHQRFRMPALARARPAQNQNKPLPHRALPL